jgi:hypothetical protein
MFDILGSIFLAGSQACTMSMDGIIEKVSGLCIWAKSYH